MAQLTEKEIIALLRKTGITGEAYKYRSDMRTAVFGGGRTSDAVTYLQGQNGSTNIYFHDNWEEYERSKSVDNRYPLSQVQTEFYDTSDFD